MFRSNSAWGRLTPVMGRPALPPLPIRGRRNCHPENADAWYHLGVSYLEQVEADARILLTRHRESALPADTDGRDLRRAAGVNSG